MYKKNCINLLIYMLLIGCMSSCATQNLFENSDSSHRKQGEIPAAYHPLLRQDSTNKYLIQPDDKLSVSIWNHDDLSIGSIFDIYNSNEVYGRWVLVDPNGEVNLPRLGFIKVQGLSTLEMQDTLKKLYSKYIVDPIILVRVLNRQVTVLGEVRTPGNYLLEKEETTLMEMIGHAEGLDFYADKRKIKLIRGFQQYKIDLTKPENIPFANLKVKSGDVIYIPSRPGKMLDKKAPTLIPFASLLTSLAVVASFLAK